MNIKRFTLLAVLLVALVPALGTHSSAGANKSYSIPIPPKNSFPVVGQDKPTGKDAVVPPQPGGLTHPCGGMFSEPPFFGMSPLSIAHVANYCSGGVYSDPYGDVYTWQANGHDYVVLSGFGLRMFYLIQVDDPYNPVLLYTMPFPSGGTTGTSAYPWKQGNNYYVSATMRGSGTGCGFFVYNVNDPANPTLVGRKAGTDWCTPHEQIVSTDSNGNADYAWLSMSGEGGSGYKVVAIDLRNLPTMTETGRYQRPDSGGNIFIHDSNVVGNRVFAGHWGGGMLIFDKNTLATSINPAPLSPMNGIRPSSFNVHHTVPTSDGNHVFIEDEFINTASAEKIKMYNITDINNPVYEGGIRGTGVAATNRAHNLRIKNLKPGHDLLFVGWYQAGTKVFSVDTNVTPPSIVEIASHQLRQATNGDFGNVWGVDYLPCTLRGISTTCMYTGDMKYGLVVDALGYNPTLDPYKPESRITDPVAGQNITSCAPYRVDAHASDYYSGVNAVDVSTDNGATWHSAYQRIYGTVYKWHYDWTPAGNGAYTLKVRARDLGNNVEVPTASIAVTVNGCAAK